MTSSIRESNTIALTLQVVEEMVRDGRMSLTEGICAAYKHGFEYATEIVRETYAAAEDEMAAHYQQEEEKTREIPY